MYDKCNYKNGLSKGFFSGLHSHAQRALHTRRRSRRIKVQTYFKKLYILYFITYILLNYGAPNQIRTDDPILTMDVLYQLSYGSEYGGARRDRTDDLLNANQALFQLSYGPEKTHTITISGWCYRMGLSSSSLIRSRLLSFFRTRLQTRISTESSANMIF